MKKLLTFFAVLILSVVFYSQDKAYADTVESYDDDSIEVVEIKEKLSVVQPIDIDTEVKLLRSTVTKNNIFIIDTEGNILPTKIVLHDDLRTVMVVPTKPLKYSTDYGILFTSDVKLQSGEYILDTVYVFKTEAKPKNAKQDVTKVKKPSLTDLNVEYLISAAFTKNNEVIFKWNKDIQVALLGSPTATDKKEVNKVLKEITALTGLTAKVTTNKSKANVKLYFGTQKWGEKYVGKMPANTPGYFIVHPTKKFFVNKADIFVNTKAGTTLKKHVIRKTLTMSLGLPNETLSSSSSIFNRYSKSTSYSSLDKKIIKALYSPYIPVGTTKEQLREMFRK
ncbi:MAG: DUF2927 domain-containing protein [Lysinibacillus sp.]